MLKSIVIIGLLYAQGTFASCTSNNCLKAVVRNADQANGFCLDYLSTPGMAIPDYLSNCKGNAAKVSSACSCLAPLPTIAPSATCPASCISTVTATSTGVVTLPAITGTVTDTVTITASGVTVTVTSVGTSAIISTVTTCGAAPAASTSSAPACPVPSTAMCTVRTFNPQFPFEVFFTGTCVTTINESYDFLITFAGATVDNECSALVVCAAFAGDNDQGGFNLSYKIAEDEWECRTYDGLLSSTQITTPNLNVGHSYGLNVLF